MSNIERFNTSKRMSQAVVHGNTVYLSGQVGTPGDDVAAQTREVLDHVTTRLQEAGSSPEQMLQAVIWLSDMRHFEAMNAVWDAWVPADAAPARACGEVRLARPALLVEITVVAALD